MKLGSGKSAARAAVAAALLLPAPGVAAAAPAQPHAPRTCGFSFSAQTFTNCHPFPHRITGYYVSGFPNAPGGNHVHCIPPNATYTALQIVGPYNLMTLVDDNVNLPCDPKKMP